jgi:drug/metabolite transporter (DMT)-like permease
VAGLGVGRLAGRALKPVLVLFGISALWSISWLTAKVALREVAPMTLAYSRFLLAIPLLALIARVQGVSLPRDRRTWLWLALAGAFAFALNYMLVFWGTQFIPSGLAAVLQATIPAATLLLSFWLLPNERLSRTGVLSIFTGIAGVIIIFSAQLSLSSPMALWGCAALAATAFTNGIGAVLIKRFLKHLKPIQLALGQQMCGVPMLMLAALTSEGLPSPGSWSTGTWGAILYMGIGASIVAFLGFYWLMSKWTAAKAAIYAIIMPVMTMALGWAFLSEQLTEQSLIGAGVVLASVVLAIRK